MKSVNKTSLKYKIIYYKKFLTVVYFAWSAPCRYKLLLSDAFTLAPPAKEREIHVVLPTSFTLLEQCHLLTHPSITQRD